MFLSCFCYCGEISCSSAATHNDSQKTNICIYIRAAECFECQRTLVFQEDCSCLNNEHISTATQKWSEDSKAAEVHALPQPNLRLRRHSGRQTTQQWSVQISIYRFAADTKNDSLTVLAVHAQL